FFTDLFLDLLSHVNKLLLGPSQANESPLRTLGASRAKAWSEFLRLTTNKNPKIRNWKPLSPHPNRSQLNCYCQPQRLHQSLPSLLFLVLTMPSTPFCFLGLKV
ncbi:hypothetical protein STEG23_006597, partial [Scotinomys teguina]